MDLYVGWSNGVIPWGNEEENDWRTSAQWGWSNGIGITPRFSVH